MSIRPPRSDKDYLPAHAKELDRAIVGVDGTNVRDLDPAALVTPLRTLVNVAESALKIGYKRNYAGEPEPYPGAAQTVMEQALRLIEAARKSGLLS